MTETSFGALQDKEPLSPPRSQWVEIWSQFRKHKGAVYGGGFLLLITLGVIVGPWIWTIDPQATPRGREFLTMRDLRPIYVALWDADAKVNWARPLGTDNLGRDILAIMLAGGRVSLAVGWLAMAISILIGTFVGVSAGFFQRADGLLMRFTDLVLSLPILPLTMVASTLFREPLRQLFLQSDNAWARSVAPEASMFILIVFIIAVTSWMQTARIVRGDVLALKEREFVLAARSIGTSNRAIIRRHLLPNLISPITVSATLGLATAIILESSLSFLGYGFPSDFPTWGKLIADYVVQMDDYPERVMYPGIALSLTVLSVNYLGDGLRDALDPRMRGR